jgi:hypothetical protein
MASTTEQQGRVQSPRIGRFEDESSGPPVARPRTSGRVFPGSDREPGQNVGDREKARAIGEGVCFERHTLQQPLRIWGRPPLLPVGARGGYSLGRDSVWGKAPSVDGFGRRSGQMVDTNYAEARPALAGEQVDPGLQVSRSSVIRAKGCIPWLIRLWPRSGRFAMVM